MGYLCCLITLLTCAFKQITDLRTSVQMAELYQSTCVPSDSTIYGVGATLAANGKVTDPGRVNGTLVLELKGWTSQKLTTMVFSIIAQELVRGCVHPRTYHATQSMRR